MWQLSVRILYSDIGFVMGRVIFNNILTPGVFPLGNEPKWRCIDHNVTSLCALNVVCMTWELGNILGYGFTHAIALFDFYFIGRACMQFEWTHGCFNSFCYAFPIWNIPISPHALIARCLIRHDIFKFITYEQNRFQDLTHDLKGRSEVSRSYGSQKHDLWDQKPSGQNHTT